VRAKVLLCRVRITNLHIPWQVLGLLKPYHLIIYLLLKKIFTNLVFSLLTFKLFNSAKKVSYNFRMKRNAGVERYNHAYIVFHVYPVTSFAADQLET